MSKSSFSAKARTLAPSRSFRRQHALAGRIALAVFGLWFVMLLLRERQALSAWVGTSRTHTLGPSKLPELLTAVAVLVDEAVLARVAAQFAKHD